MGTTKSGWCLRPYSEWSKDEHDKCPKNFATGGTCSCTCAHPSERSRDSFAGNGSWAPAGGGSTPRGRASVDKATEPVYAKRVPTKGGAEALRSLHTKGEANDHHTDDPEPEA